MILRMDLVANINIEKHKVTVFTVTFAATRFDFKYSGPLQSVYISEYLRLFLKIHSFIHSLVFSLRGRVGRNQSPVM